MERVVIQSNKDLSTEETEESIVRQLQETLTIFNTLLTKARDNAISIDFELRESSNIGQIVQIDHLYDFNMVKAEKRFVTTYIDNTKSDVS